MGSRIFEIKGIFTRSHFNSQRCPNKFEVFAESPLEVSFVGVCDMFEGISVNHNDGRIHAALVRVAQLGPEHARSFWGLMLNSLLEQAGQDRCGELADSGLVGIGNGLPDSTQTLPANR